jgi:hypothetical protein
MALDLQYVHELLVSLEDNIKIVIDASVPNKQQNKASKKMAEDYFFETRNYIREYLDSPDVKKKLAGGNAQ